MTDQVPPTITMEVLRDGTFDGVSYHAGDTVDVDPAVVETLVLAGFAAPADRVARAHQAREPAPGAPVVPEKKPRTVKSAS